MSSTTLQAVNANPTTPVYTNDLEWITAFFTVHMMSDNSRRYIYFLWFCVTAVFIACSAFHLAGSSGGVLGAHWTKWAICRRTWRGQHFLHSRHLKGARRHPISLPPNGQLMTLALILTATLILAFAGPDYINPSNQLFDITNPGLTARVYDVNTFTRWQPNYTIHKSMWTMGGRAGLLAFGMFPLCVLFALKSPPFAVFALPFTTQMHFDKLSWLHRWTGRLIYVITVLHVVFWSVQLGTDRRPRSNKVAYTYAWLYEKFIYGWIAFLCMTLLVVLSIPVIRKNHYETFYALHVLLVPLTLVLSALHHPPVWIWCWAALALWAGERAWRGTWWLYVNGIFGRDKNFAPAIVSRTHRKVDSEQQALRPSQYEEPGGYPPPSPFLSSEFSHASKLLEPVTALKYSPPPGYAHAELLSGATVRLTFISPRHFSWAPGQHFLINIPSVSKILTHPFTTASICDEQASESGRAIVLLVRSKGGWTRDLWDFVLQLVTGGENHAPGENLPIGTAMPGHGILLRMFVDGPFGSAVRAKWESHSTVVIFVAGSGVSFGLSILEYVCLCLAGRDGKHLGGRAGGWGRKGFATRRVRFVWLVREFAHIQWCASIIRRCMEMIPSPGLDVDIFVTDATPTVKAPPTNPGVSTANRVDPLDLAPPAPIFGSTHSSRSLAGGSDYSSDSEVEDNFSNGEYGDEMDITGVHLNDNQLQLTNFDGDNDFSLPGEAQLNKRVRRVGKKRRAHSRRFSKAIAIKDSLGDGQSSRMSAQSTNGLLSQGWTPPQSKDIPLYSPVDEEGDVGFAHMDSSYGLYSPPSNKHATLPGTASPPCASMSHPVSPSFIPHKPLMARPRTPSLTTYNSPTASQSVISFGTDVLTHEDGGRLHTLQLHGLEMRDISFVAERARPGQPRLDHILKDEVDSASGSIIVACCGPTSFSAMIRKAIAFQIDPARIRRGDRRGHIDLVTEEFEY